MPGSSRRHYLLVENRYRRYSAPENIRSGNYTSEESEQESSRSKVSSIDFSILFEGQSGSDSSLELDTTISRDVSPAPVPRPSFNGESCYDCQANHNGQNMWCLICTWPAWKTVFVAQGMSFCLSVIDLTVNHMNRTTNPLPASVKIFPLYLFLGLFWTPHLAVRGGGRGLIQVLRHSGLRYIFLSIFHVVGAAMTLSTLEEKSFIGNQCIDCVAAWLSFMVAYVCLDVEFEKTHVAGFGIAFLGAIGMWVANPEVISEEDEPWGDIIRFGIGLYVSLNTLAQELIVKSIDTVEYLGMIGFLGSIICGVQAIVVDDGCDVPTEPMFWCALIIFSTTQFLFSCLAPKVLRDIGTTGLHLALISSPFYHQFLFYCIDNGPVTFQFFTFPYLLIVIGSYIFTLKRTTIGKHYFYPVQVTLGN